jgi:hypothetical protein
MHLTLAEALILDFLEDCGQELDSETSWSISGDALATGNDVTTFADLVEALCKERQEPTKVARTQPF